MDNLRTGKEWTRDWMSTLPSCKAILVLEAMPIADVMLDAVGKIKRVAA
jgi:hypothetical protein